MRRVHVVATLLVLAGVAGCIERTSPVEVTPFHVINDAEPGRPTQFAFRLESTSPFKQTLPVRAEGPAGWTLEPEVAELSLGGGSTTSLVLTVVPDRNATYEPADVHLHVGDTRARVIVDVRDLGTEPLRAGIGATLTYVLWWDNGTLASTNDPALRNRTGIGPAVLDGNASGFEPLKVYVGGKRGTPPPEPYNSTGYRPVIDGFDARLRDAGDGRGMVAGDTLAVTVPPEKAYTRPGNESHPLYGDTLHFLIRVLTVDVLPVRACDLPVCPTLPEGER